MLLQFNQSMLDIFDKNFKCRPTGSDGPAAKKENPNTKIFASATEHINRVETEMVMVKYKSQLSVKVVTIYIN